MIINKTIKQNQKIKNFINKHFLKNNHFKMNTIEIMQQAKKENRLENNVNGRLFSALKKIWDQNNKEIFFIKDSTGNYLNEFEYDGKEISAWLRINGVEVWDYGWGGKEYFVSLYDLAKCPDLLKAVNLVEQEKWINFSTNSTIDLDECFDLVWVEEKTHPVLILVDRWLRDIVKIQEILNDIVNDLKILLNPDYDIWISNMTYKIFIEAKNQSAKDNITNLSPEFINKIQKIQEYFKDNVSKLNDKIDNAVFQQKLDSEKIYKNDLQRIETLRQKL